MTTECLLCKFGEWACKTVNGHRHFPVGALVTACADGMGFPTLNSLKKGFCDARPSSIVVLIYTWLGAPCHLAPDHLRPPTQQKHTCEKGRATASHPQHSTQEINDSTLLKKWLNICTRTMSCAKMYSHTTHTHPGMHATWVRYTNASKPIAQRWAHRSGCAPPFFFHPGAALG